ncbi:MAG: hypothetical protein ABI661_04275, partial [Gammaproteobacteria bacterium]
MITEADARQGSTGTADPPLPGVLDELSGALASARAGLAGFLDLVTLEARRAGLSLIWMVACGLAAAICLVAAWFGVLVAVAIWAISLGLPSVTAVISLAAVNAVAGVGLLLLCIGRSEDLRFSATRRQLAGRPPPT